MITDIIARLEAATEGSRELDAAIADTLSNSVESDDGDFWWGPHDALPVRVPDFSTSIDCALTLVPTEEHWQDDEISFDLSTEFGQWTADFTCLKGAQNDMSYTGRFYVRAKTAPLAICIASLRARLPLESVT